MRPRRRILLQPSVKLTDYKNTVRVFRFHSFSDTDDLYIVKNFDLT
jgi:hypothetical protein